MELTDLITIGGAATLTTILVQAIKSALSMTAEQADRFGLLLAIATACVVTVPTAIYIGSDPVSAALAGILAGASSVGIYKAAQKSPIGIEFGGGSSDPAQHPYD